MKCKICRSNCDGKNVIVIPPTGEHLVVCGDCLNDFGNQDYEKLMKKLVKK